MIKITFEEFKKAKKVRLETRKKLKQARTELEIAQKKKKHDVISAARIQFKNALKSHNDAIEKTQNLKQKFDELINLAINQTYGKVDHPKNKEKIEYDVMVVSGWAFSKSDEELTIEIYVDDNKVKVARWGLPRFDVFKEYPSEMGYESGFIARIATTKIKKGLHNIKVKAKIFDKEKTIGHTEFIKRLNEKKKKSFVFPIPAGGPGRYKIMGQEYLKFFCQKANLQPNYKVLEVGCGMGRMAMPLTKYLDTNGEYYSIDNIQQIIEYNKKNISSRYSNFHFIFADVYNNMYNPTGKFKAAEYKFPFDDEIFDFVFLASVFTHFVFDDMKNYLSEIHRVLKKGGRCFITYFLLNDKTGKLDSSRNEINFKYRFDRYYSTNTKVPEQAIAFEGELVRELYKKFGLKIEEPIYFGKWHGNKESLASQDIIIAKK